MQVNPTDNYVMREALQRWSPIRITRLGDMTPWHPWTNVRPFVVTLLNVSEERYWLTRFMSRAFSGATWMDTRFPPVSRGQWFFGILQALTRLVEGLMTKRSSRGRPEASLYEMDL